MEDDIRFKPRLADTFNGRCLTQIYSVNSFSQLRKIELHGDRMLEIEFEDGGELLLIHKKAEADAIIRQVRSIHNEILKNRQE